MFQLSVVLLLSACSPQPVSGVWKATQDNEYGISGLVVSFGGRAEFVTRKLNNATWHCFWGAIASHEASLECTSSVNIEQTEDFHLTVNEQGFAELRHKLKLVGTFKLTNENPKL